MERYLTIVGRAEAEFTERRSRFLSVALPVANEKEALAALAERRSSYWDATHNVYAYVLREGQVRRYSDDAEPQGTAGIPTLEVLNRAGVTDVCVITTRYFGGILLCAGGLVRAYAHAAALALEAAGIVTMAPVTFCTMTCEYFLFGKLDALLASFGAIERTNDFAEGVTLRFAVESERVAALAAAVNDAAAGQVRLLTGDEAYRPVAKK
ncbi:MAG: YigZ family protein [Clostridia bacterium]|nr:YigZ family protein [Clostridia bacterium]